METDFSAIDHAHMTRALRLAERGLCSTQPNPRVGCVLAHGDTVVGEGWHARAGEAHAEVCALRNAGPRARGATAYVSLEPCAHHGSTPPCAEALIAAGVARMVSASDDPNPRVDGRGLDLLRGAGIEVQSGLMRDAARELNRGFFSRIERGRPWLRVKLAMSLDGRTALADGSSKWITGEAARADGHRWRARSSAILTGVGTVRADNPALTVRLQLASADVSAAPQAVPPWRVVLDPRLTMHADTRVLDGAVPTLVLHEPDAHRAEHFDRVECVAIDASEHRLDLRAALTALATRGVNELQVEAGPTLSGALFDAGLVDEWLLYVAPVLLGAAARPLLAMSSPSAMASAHRWQTVDRRAFDDDLRLLLRPGKGAA